MVNYDGCLHCSKLILGECHGVFVFLHVNYAVVGLFFEPLLAECAVSAVALDALVLAENGDVRHFNTPSKKRRVIAGRKTLSKERS